MSWTSARPFGVGTTRAVKSLKGASLLHERYFTWDEGSRMSFYVVESSAPLFKRFAEDYVVEPTSDASCRFSWTIAVEPHAAAKIADPLNRRLLGSLFRERGSTTARADPGRPLRSCSGAAPRPVASWS